MYERDKNVDRDGISKAFKEMNKRVEAAHQCEFIVKVNDIEYYAPVSENKYVKQRVKEALDWGLAEHDKYYGLNLIWKAWKANGEKVGPQKLTIEVIGTEQE